MSVDFALHLHYNLNKVGENMKKGFTLIELIAVVAILGLIALVVYPAIGSVIKNAREETYNDQVDVIINAAKEWSTDIKNVAKLTSDGSAYELTVQTLIDEGYIKNNEIKDPRNSEKNMDGTVLIRYNKEIKSYDYTYRENEKNTISMRIYPKKSLKYL